MTLAAHDAHVDNKNMLWLEVTNFCNLECSHCYNTSGPREPLEPTINAERYRGILNEARAIGFKRVQFIGGEPLFYPHLKEIVDHAIRIGFEYVEIFSNLTTIPLWLFMPEYRRIQIATSVYSDDPNTHDKVTAAKDSFKRTVVSIKRLAAAGFSIRAGFIEMGVNAGHFERTREFLNGMGVMEVGWDAVREFGRANHQERPDMAELCGHCSQGNLSIDVNGNVSACIMSKRWAFGNVHETSVQELFDSTDRRKFVLDLEQNIKQRESIQPMLCSPYDQGQCGPQCQPSCYPSQNCNPCAPSGSNPCNPNDRCGPF